MVGEKSLTLKVIVKAARQTIDLTVDRDMLILKG